eukprot:g7550.t1
MDRHERLTESLISAVRADNIGLVENLLFNQGADVNAGVPAKQLRVGDAPVLIGGSRPIHFVVGRKNQDPMARLLLKAGADPGLPDKYGYTALHTAARIGDAEMLDLLLSSRFSKSMSLALTTTTSNGESPLSLAAADGHSAAVSRLLRAGAKHKVSIMGGPCALRSAIRYNHADVVRLLLDNIDAVGGLATLPFMLTCAALRGRARILHMLLSVEGENKRRKWARESCQGLPLLTFAAGYGVLGNVSVLLAAGADETIVDSRGRTVADMIGFCLEDGQKNPVEARAVSRVLQRAPAYRALSWRWQRGSGGEAVARTGGSTSSPGQAPRSPVGVAIFRPRGNKLVMKPVFRYALKR